MQLGSSIFVTAGKRQRRDLNNIFKFSFHLRRGSRGVGAGRRSGLLPRWLKLLLWWLRLIFVILKRKTIGPRHLGSIILFFLSFCYVDATAKKWNEVSSFFECFRRWKIFSFTTQEQVNHVLCSGSLPGLCYAPTEHNQISSRYYGRQTGCFLKTDILVKSLGVENASI